MNIQNVLRTLGVAAALALAFPAVAAEPAPAFTIRGVILERPNGYPVVGATVSLVVNGESTISNPDGVFSFGQVQLSAPDQLLIRRAGYVPVIIPLGILPDGAWTLNLTLERLPIEVGQAATGLPQ